MRIRNGAVVAVAMAATVGLIIYAQTSSPDATPRDPSTPSSSSTAAPTPATTHADVTSTPTATASAPDSTAAAQDDDPVVSYEPAKFSEEADASAEAAALTFWDVFTDHAATHAAWVAELRPLVSDEFCHNFGKCDDPASDRTGEHFDVNGTVVATRVERTSLPVSTRVWFTTTEGEFYVQVIREDENSPWIVVKWY